MAELRSNVVFHGRHFVRHLGICNPICVKLPYVCGVIPSNIIEKRRLYLKPFSWGPQTRHTHSHTDRQTDRHTHTHTQDDSIMRNAMRCISPKNISLHYRIFMRNATLHFASIAFRVCVCVSVCVCVCLCVCVCVCAAFVNARKTVEIETSVFF